MPPCPAAAAALGTSIPGTTVGGGQRMTEHFFRASIVNFLHTEAAKPSLARVFWVF